MLKRFAAVALAATALITLVSCGDEPAISPPMSIESPGPGHLETTRRARFTMSVSGAESFRIRKDDAVLHFYEIIGDATPRLSWFFSASAVPGQYITAPDGRWLLFTADLEPGTYQGAGTYSILATAKNAPIEGATGIAGASYLALIRPKPQPSERRFALLERPCTFRVGEKYRTGSVHCPRLADAKGETVDVRWTWELT